MFTKILNIIKKLTKIFLITKGTDWRILCF